MATATQIASPAQRVHTRSPLALWHLLSLDAPCVAAVWTVFFARTFHVPLLWTAPAALALAVWLLYAADRLADAAQGGGTLEERHRFHRLHRSGFSAGMMCSLPVLAALLLAMPLAVRNAWLLLATPLLLYVVAVHVLRLRSVPKEVLVAVFFAAATVLPVVVSRIGPHKDALLAAGAFGSVCWLNGTCIARWENKAPCDKRRVTAAVLLVLVLGSLAALSHPSVTLACLVSAGALLLLDRSRNRLSALHLRALADAALLSPLLLLPVLLQR